MNKHKKELNIHFKTVNKNNLTSSIFDSKTHPKTVVFVFIIKESFFSEAGEWDEEVQKHDESQLNS